MRRPSSYASRSGVWRSRRFRCIVERYLRASTLTCCSYVPLGNVTVGRSRGQATLRSLTRSWTCFGNGRVVSLGGSSVIAGGLPRGLVLSKGTCTGTSSVADITDVSQNGSIEGQASSEPCDGSVLGSKVGCRSKVQWTKVRPSSLQNVICVAETHIVNDTSVLACASRAADSRRSLSHWG